MCLFFLSLSNTFSFVKWQEVDLDQQFELSLCGQNEESKHSHVPKSVTTWFLVWFSFSLLPARLSQDTASLSQEMVETVADNVNNMGIILLWHFDTSETRS